MTINAIRTSLLAATFAAVASVVATAPAHALSLFGNINLGGNVKVSGNSSNYKFDFLNEVTPPNATPGTAGDVVVFGGTGSFEGAGEAAGGAKIRDFATSSATSNFPDGALTNFITGIKLANGTVLSFDLSEFNDFTLAFPPVGTSNGGTFLGTFRDSNNDSVAGKGILTAQFLGTNDFTGVTSYSASLGAAPVPTPALLPGVIGLGVAALRKRKSNEDASTEEA